MKFSNSLSSLIFYMWVLLAGLATKGLLLDSTIEDAIANATSHCLGRSCSGSKDSIPCYCDAMCEWFGDCCGEYNRTQEQLHHSVRNESLIPKRSLLECVQPCSKNSIFCVTTGAVPMITKCPATNVIRGSTLDKDLANNCSNFTGDLPPITDNTTGIVYRNAYCALCNGMPIDNIIEWTPVFPIGCKPQSIIISSDNATNFTISITCPVLSYEPPNLEHNTQRLCTPSLVNTCPDTLINNGSQANISSADYDELVSKCTTSGIDVIMYPTHGQLLHYANPYCAVCNYIGLTDTLDLSCHRYFYITHAVEKVNNDKLDTEPIIQAFVEVILPNAISILQCDNGSVYDPKLKDCRVEIFISPNLQPNATANVSSKVNGNGTLAVCHGSYIALKETEYLWLLFNETLLWVSNNVTYYIAGFHNVNEPIICVNLSRTYDISAGFPDPSHRLATDILSYIGLVLDIVSGIFILITYCSFKDLQTLYGKLLLNMVIITIASDVSLVLGYPFSKIINSNSYCTAMSIVIHLVFLARFFSCSVLFCEATRTFYLALKVVPAEEKRGKQMCRYLCLYLIPVYAVSSLIVLTSVVLNFTLEGSIGYGYGVNLCWMSNRIAVGITFVAPLCLTLMFNTFCFIFCTLVIIKLSRFSKTTKEKLSVMTAVFQNFRVIVAFFSVSGISWISFILVLIPGSDGRRQVWGSYIFVILNSSQLLLVALAYVCTKKVLQKYSRTARKKAMQLSCYKPSSVPAGKQVRTQFTSTSL